MTGLLIVSGVCFVFGVLVAWSLCRAAADGDRTYGQMVRGLHRRGPIYWDDPDLPADGCVYCRVPWPCQTVREL